MVDKSATLHLRTGSATGAKIAPTIRSAPNFGNIFDLRPFDVQTVAGEALFHDSVVAAGSGYQPPVSYQLRDG
jgi:hypothetical protein